MFLIYSIYTETDLDDGSEVFSMDVVLCLQVQVTQLAGSYRVVFRVELIESLEGLSTLQGNSRESRQ